MDVGTLNQFKKVHGKLAKNNVSMKDLAAFGLSLPRMSEGERDALVAKDNEMAKMQGRPYRTLLTLYLAKRELDKKDGFHGTD